MRTRMLLTTLTLTAMLAAAVALAGQQGDNQQQGPAGQGPATTQLTEVEAQNIVSMREEEKLARDVYLTFAGRYGDCPVFANIAESEKRHMAAVGLLINKYGLTDPVADDTVGMFTDPDFATLYGTLTESGGKSLLDALKAGVQIEEMDIADLEQALTETDKADIQWVFGNLLRGSNNHLRAFTRNVETGGTVCTLQGSGAGAGNGRRGAGNGMGQGRGRGGRGNGNGWGCGNCSGGGNQTGVCLQNQQQNRDGTCLVNAPAADTQP